MISDGVLPHGVVAQLQRACGATHLAGLTEHHLVRKSKLDALRREWDRAARKPACDIHGIDSELSDDDSGTRVAGGDAGHDHDDAKSNDGAAVADAQPTVKRLRVKSFRRLYNRFAGRFKKCKVVFKLSKEDAQEELVSMVASVVVSSRSSNRQAR